MDKIARSSGRVTTVSSDSLLALSVLEEGAIRMHYDV